MELAQQELIWINNLNLYHILMLMKKEKFKLKNYYKKFKFTINNY